MIPLRDVVPTRLTPWTTLTIAAAHVAWFLTSSVASPTLPETTGDPLGAPSGWVPLVAQIVTLWLFGSTVEDRLGPARFVLLFLVGGLAGASVVSVLAPTLGPAFGSPTAALAAVVGAYLVLFPTSRVLVLVPVPGLFDVVELPALFFAGTWIVVQLLLAPGAIVDPPPTGGLAWWTTAVGLAVGMAAAPVLRRRARMQPSWWDPRLSGRRSSAESRGRQSPVR